MPRTSRAATKFHRQAWHLFVSLLLASALAYSAPAQQTGDVTINLTVRVNGGEPHPPSVHAPVVVWLSALGADGQPDLTIRPGVGKSFQMVQKDKMFQPHLLVLPTGSMVAFPNRDPFFHNVFSLFNGRRFDLGLYETGVSHSVPFDREGVSYIFCNIHPEMGAVIVSVATPYFIVANQSPVQLHHVQPGVYLLKVWAEDATVTSLDRASRRLRVGNGSTDAGTVDISLQPHTMHNDKFGKPYSQHPADHPY